jgi:hypothetical protein
MYRAVACIRSTVRSCIARGLHRLQARNPVPSAASGLAKNRTLLGLGGREAQDGRQYTPVVITPYTNAPSKLPSRADTARCIAILGGIVGGRERFGTVMS